MKTVKTYDEFLSEGKLIRTIGKTYVAFLTLKDFFKNIFNKSDLSVFNVDNKNIRYVFIDIQDYVYELKKKGELSAKEVKDGYYKLHKRHFTDDLKKAIAVMKKYQKLEDVTDANKEKAVKAIEIMTELIHSRFLNEKFLNENQNKLSEESIADLEIFKDSLQFIVNYDNMEIYEAIQCIDELLNSSWNDIMEIREHLITNHTRNDKDNFMIELIDRYCSNISEKNKLL